MTDITRIAGVAPSISATTIRPRPAVGATEPVDSVAEAIAYFAALQAEDTPPVPPAADLTDEGAKLLALQTRSQLQLAGERASSTTSQALLSLFGARFE